MRFYMKQKNLAENSFVPAKRDINHLSFFFLNIIP